MINDLKTLNIALSTACGEGQVLRGCVFIKNAMKEFTKFPAIGTKLTGVEVLSTNGGTIIPTGNGVVLFSADLLDSFDDDLVALYEEILNKLNIMFGIAKGSVDEDIEIIDSTFLGGKKGAIAVITINI